MKCQVLYNLSNANGWWISGADIHDLFFALIGDPSPSGSKDFDVSKWKKLDPLGCQLGAREGFAVMVDRDSEWETKALGLAIDEATSVAWNLRKSKRFHDILVVPNEAVLLMEGHNPNQITFEGGMVIDDRAEERCVITL
jgi:hypothetical protein